MASNEEIKQDDVVALELPAPAGWIKKLTPKKGSGSKKNNIIFISPDGEEIKNKRQLEQYLKSHPGGPAVSEFYWGTGDTPRRSARLGDKSKTVEAPGSESPKKKRKISGTNEEDMKKNGEGEATADNDAAEGSKEGADKDAAAEENKEGADKDAAAEESKESADKDAAAEETKKAADKDAAAKETKEAADKDAAAEENKEGAEDVRDSKIIIITDTEGVDKEAKTEVSLAVEIPKDGTNENTNPEVEETNDPKIEVSQDASTEVAGEKADESKDAEKETPSEKIDIAETIMEDPENPKEKQAAEEPMEKDTVSQKPTT